MNFVSLIIFFKNCTIRFTDICVSALHLCCGRSKVWGEHIWWRALSVRSAERPHPPPAQRVQAHHSEGHAERLLRPVPADVRTINTHKQNPNHSHFHKLTAAFPIVGFWSRVTTVTWRLWCTVRCSRPTGVSWVPDLNTSLTCWRPSGRARVRSHSNIHW